MRTQKSDLEDPKYETVDCPDCADELERWGLTPRYADSFGYLVSVDTESDDGIPQIHLECKRHCGLWLNLSVESVRTSVCRFCNKPAVVEPEPTRRTPPGESR